MARKVLAAAAGAAESPEDDIERARRLREAPEKPHVNVGTIGHIDHGRSVVMDTIAAHPGYPSADQVNAMSTERKLQELVHWRTQMDTKTSDLRTRIELLQRELEAKVVIERAICADLEERIKADVIDRRETVKAAGLMAKFCKGRAGGWDTAKLDGYAAAHPEILPFKKADGQPYATIEADRAKG
jgi:hypothetical protein